MLMIPLNVVFKFVHNLHGLTLKMIQGLVFLDVLMTHLVKIILDNVFQVVLIGEHMLIILQHIV